MRGLSLGVISVLLFSIFYMAGCSCDCEVECTEGNQTYTVPQAHMQRSECERQNDPNLIRMGLRDTSCTYRCRD
jgi:hypothetical protein